MERRDHHDWASDAYVEEWVERQRAADPDRAQLPDHVRSVPLPMTPGSRSWM